MTDIVVAVIVTFNRKQHLTECIKSLTTQTHALSKIIVVDNASTDGTKDLFEQRGLLEKDIFRYERLETNTGGAGGFHTGIKIALATYPDWIWVMDDDVAPEPNCLEELLKYKSVSECIHPRKILIDGSDYHWEHQIDIKTGTRTIIRNMSFANGKNIVFTNVACFEGMLVSRRIVELVGLPDPKYFILEDDTLFGIKSSVHTNVSFVLTAVMRKLIRPNEITPWKAYYKIRNRFYLFRDSLDFFSMHPSLSTKISFLFLQFVELINVICHGNAFYAPAFRGFYHGIIYAFKKRRDISS